MRNHARISIFSMFVYALEATLGGLNVRIALRLDVQQCCYLGSAFALATAERQCHSQQAIFCHKLFKDVVLDWQLFIIVGYWNLGGAYAGLALYLALASLGGNLGVLRSHPGTILEVIFGLLGIMKIMLMPLSPR